MQQAHSFIIQELKESADVLNAFLSNQHNIEQIHQAAVLMSESLKEGGKIISCGNGGSMADAMHFAEELSGRFRQNRMALPAIAISDPTHLSCVANDYGYLFVFSRFVEAFGNSGDVLLAISTSGNSENVLRAAQTALEKGMIVIALTGKNGGLLAENCSLEIRVPHQGFADRIQEIHIKVIHILIALIEKNLHLA
jgi:D-sedoheptulose 7-phosphate isomerase